jgi:Ca2+-transporting ATPase
VVSASEFQQLCGLDEAEAALRLAQDGTNTLPGSEPKSMLRIALGVLVEPMFLMLLAAGGIYLLIGDAAEAVFLLGSVFVIIGLTLAQERKTQRALEALRQLSAPRALVLRSGREQRIASCDVVRGDLLVLHEGDRIAADAVLLQGQLSTDEALLTGESVPLDKTSTGGAAAATVFASTVVTRGVGVARVTQTGAHTAVGRVGAALASTALVPSGLQLASRAIVRRLAVAGLAVALCLVLLSWLWDGRPLLDSLLLGIALAMAVLPEEIPVVLTVFLALGAWRLSRQHVLTRRVQAVEALGAITVLALDKTGTLTQNRMMVAELWSPDASYTQANGQALPENLHGLAEFALLATPQDPFDPMEKAIRSFGQQHLAGTEHWHAQWTPEQTYPLSSQILAVTHGFARDEPAQARPGHLLASKGAPEAMADLCHLEPHAARALDAQVQAMAARGLRVLAVAKGQWRGDVWPASQHDLSFEMLGLIGLADPPRPDALPAVAACRAARIRILMLTGDHPATARAIAAQVGSILALAPC